MRVFINPGHDLVYDSGALNADGTRECDIAADIGARVKRYLEAAGVECELMQSDNLAPTSTGRSVYADRQGDTVTECANEWCADLFISIHCNAANGNARGTEVEIYQSGGASELLAHCIQDQIVNSLGTIDRGAKEMPQLLVLRYTDMPAVLVETAFIDNDDDCALLKDRTDEFARSIARGVTDYELA